MSYTENLLTQRAKRTDLELTWELEEALNEALEADIALSAPELLAWHVCTVAHCDGIAEVLEEQPKSIPIAAKFARKRGLLQTADTLDKIVKGIGADDPVSMTMTSKIGGKPMDIDLPEIPWGAADLFLSMVDEDLDAAILDFVAENISAFSLPPPASVLKKAKKKQKVVKQASSKTAAQMLQALLAHRIPVLRCTLPTDGNNVDANKFIDVAVTHVGEESASSKHIASLRKQYGAAANALFEILAVHDGAALFVSNNEAAFYLVPSGFWGQHMEDVMSWAQQVTWQDDLDEIPTYLKTAIPFGYTPGDSERWLLITEGPHAGKVMLSDTDVIDDKPRYESLAEFLSTLVIDCERILCNGGQVSYDSEGHSASGGSECFHPSKYLFSE